MKTKKVLSVRKYRAGYEVRDELIDGKRFGTKDFIRKSAYTPSGDWIGNSRDAYRLCMKRGIAPEKANSKHCVCSIGFSERLQKWFGWSHRAIFGFKVGDVVKEGDCTASPGVTEEYLKDHPDEDISLPVGFKAKNLKDCKRMAMVFAESVG